MKQICSREDHVTRMRLLMLLLGVAFLSACASQRPPEGGPPDTEAPFIEETYPANETVRFDGGEVSLRFNEYVQRQSFVDAVHISPLPEEQPEYEWSGKEVTIVFPDTLLADRTYVITVGTKVKDQHAGNPMLGTFHLAFSTGDSLDTGRFSGLVLDEKPSGITILAYLLTPEIADTLDPSTDRPDYAVQTGDDGSFHFYNVAPGNYRVFAIRDRSNDLKYNVESEEIGIPNRDITAGDSLSPDAHLRFLIAKEDTTRPSVQRIEALSARTVRVKFNETLYPQPLPLTWLRIRDTMTVTDVPVIAALAPPGERYAWDLYTQTELSGGPYSLELDSLRDGDFNMILLPDSGLVFPGSAIPDTTAPTLLRRFPTNRARTVPPDSSFWVVFDSPMSPGCSVQLTDSSGNAVPVDLHWSSADELRIEHSLLQDEAVYTLCLDLTSLRDTVSGISTGDSTECISFTTGLQDRFGTVSGTVTSEDSSATVRIRLQGTGKTDVSMEAAADATRTFQFIRVPEGSYILDAYQDNDNNGRFFPGTANPFRPPEPFGILRDTIRVRARWETNGITIPIR
ncbi:MAG: hypothetical protein C0600_02500 [Ignavibacteria bacterium]|nr:MAG: hypothetical protein C0600_02500 [Ignavibacteria bacterium]